MVLLRSPRTPVCTPPWRRSSPVPCSTRVLTNGIINDIIDSMPAVAAIPRQMREAPGSTRFRDLCKVCDHFFGTPRQSGTSHRVYRTPWHGDPRINIQNAKGMTKVYRVKQVLLAVSRLEDQDA